MNRNKLYTILFIASVAGYAWIYFNFKNENVIQSFDVCLIKHAINIPCPSCGSTRSVMLLSQGNFKDAFLINPLGYVVALIMIVFPFWIFYDFATRRQSLFNYYKIFESKLIMPMYSIPVSLLIVFNWVWNIIKGV